MILTAKRLYDDLDYWIMIGIGDDIVMFKDHRPEYQSYVKRHEKEETEKIPELVLADLKKEMELPLLFQASFWKFLPRNIKHIGKGLAHGIARKTIKRLR